MSIRLLLLLLPLLYHSIPRTRRGREEGRDGGDGGSGDDDGSGGDGDVASSLALAFVIVVVVVVVVVGRPPHLLPLLCHPLLHP